MEVAKQGIASPEKPIQEKSCFTIAELKNSETKVRNGTESARSREIGKANSYPRTGQFDAVYRVQETTDTTWRHPAGKSTDKSSKETNTKSQAIWIAA